MPRPGKRPTLAFTLHPFSASAAIQLLHVYAAVHLLNCLCHRPCCKKTSPLCCLLQSIRYTNHVNFLITIPVGPDAPGLTPEYVSSVLALGSNFFTVGTRGFYFAFPLLLWLFGPIPMVVSCAVLVPALYWLDSASGFGITLSAEPSSQGGDAHCHDGGGAARTGVEGSHRDHRQGSLNGVHAVDIEMESSPCLHGAKEEGKVEEHDGGKSGGSRGLGETEKSQHGRTID